MLKETTLSALHEAREPRWINVSGMRVPGSYAREGDPMDLALTDLSFFPKVGLKGPRASEWLAQRGVPVPLRPNSWVPTPSGGLAARLAETEFLVEDEGAFQLEQDLLVPTPLVYLVIRQDCAVALSGPRANDVLLQTCSFDFGSLQDSDAVIMTSMIGVPVLVIPGCNPSRIPHIRIWVDPTFGPHLWRTLLEIVEELGGGPAGVTHFVPLGVRPGS